MSNRPNLTAAQWLEYWQGKMDKLTGKWSGYCVPEMVGFQRWQQITCQVADRIAYYRRLSQSENA